jgi:hypothetical protein
MTKRNRIATVVVLVAVMGLVLWRTAGPEEPAYEGKKLTSWLDHHVASSSATPPYGSPGWKKADEALRAIGTNAIPTLLQMLRAKDPPPFLRTLMTMAGRLGFSVFNRRYAMPQHDEAEYAFQILGTNGVSAVPGLIRIYEENISASSQRNTALALGSIGRAAQPALPALIRRFTHTNPDVRFYAVSAVAEIGGDPAIVVPALTGALKDSFKSVRWNALSGLSSFGARARPAVPEILKLLNDTAMSGSMSITQQVEVTLWRIAPEKIGYPLLVEATTPMVTNGISAQALKVLYYGKRRTLIPPGKSLPLTYQHWNSDPRPRITLYRGTHGVNDNDHFLGHFEVLGLQPSPNLNVSTLCIVVDGQIIITARDNTGEKFLKIRRVEPDDAQ